MASKLNPLALRLCCRTLYPSARLSTRQVTLVHELEGWGITAEFRRPLIHRPRSFSSISRLEDADGIKAAYNGECLSILSQRLDVDACADSCAVANLSQ
jgi:hypothetical protein